MKILRTILSIFLSMILFGVLIFFGFTPSGKSLILKYDHTMKKVDEQAYKVKKEVEGTARAYIASFKQQTTQYEHYIDYCEQDLNIKTNANYCEIAQQSKIRAINTMSTYNEYILKNSYIWENNIPSDIYYRLEYIWR